MDAQVSSYVFSGIQLACSMAARIPPSTTIQCVEYRLANPDWEMRDYYPTLCRQLRSAYGYDEDNFLQSWSVNSTFVDPQPSAGRSGSLFQKSRDGKHIFKVISSEEFESLVELFPDYWEHMMTHDHSLLAPVLGLHLFDNVEKDETYYVVVLKNLCDFSAFPPALYSDFVVFDLKGREPKPGHFVNRRLVQKGSILKDNNLDHHFYLPPRLLELFQQQLEADVKFLQSHNLMDYSLLVGVASRDSKDLSSAVVPVRKTSMRSVFHSVCGGVPRDSTCSEVYMLGIIDFFTQYGTLKSVAHFFKSLRWSPSQLSTVPATDYATRFLAYFQKCFQPTTKSQLYVPLGIDNNSSSCETTVTAPVESPPKQARQASSANQDVVVTPPLPPPPPSNQHQHHKGKAMIGTATTTTTSTSTSTSTSTATIAMDGEGENDKLRLVQKHMKVNSVGSGSDLPTVSSSAYEQQENLSDLPSVFSTTAITTTTTAAAASTTSTSTSVVTGVQGGGGAADSNHSSQAITITSMTKKVPVAAKAVETVTEAEVDEIKSVIKTKIEAEAVTTTS